MEWPEAVRYLRDTYSAAKPLIEVELGKKRIVGMTPRAEIVAESSHPALEISVTDYVKKSSLDDREQALHNILKQILSDSSLSVEYRGIRLPKRNKDDVPVYERLYVFRVHPVFEVGPLPPPVQEKADSTSNITLARERMGRALDALTRYSKLAEKPDAFFEEAFIVVEEMAKKIPESKINGFYRVLTERIETALEMRGRQNRVPEDKLVNEKPPVSLPDLEAILVLVKKEVHPR